MALKHARELARKDRLDEGNAEIQSDEAPGQNQRRQQPEAGAPQQNDIAGVSWILLHVNFLPGLCARSTLFRAATAAIASV